jgi:hypothetical protein
MHTQEESLEKILQLFRSSIAGDFEKYSNHVHRVFHNCCLIDPANADKYAVAAVFHDIGIWTDHTIDYLDPSIRQAEMFLLESGQAAWTAEITAMIYWHHKTGKYTGAYSATVEVFRKADWIDVSLGLMNFGLKRSEIRKSGRRFPNRGFHWFLIRKIAANFFRHPRHPLPMFKP